MFFILREIVETNNNWVLSNYVQCLTSSPANFTKEKFI